MTPSFSANERGIALIMVMLVTTFLSAIGLGVLLALFMDRLATGNVAGSVAMLYAADAGIEIAARDLAQIADWDDALRGAQRSSFRDGIAGGIRNLPGGGTVDLTAATSLLNCGRSANCTPPQMNANSKERPWGPNNPRWQLFAYGPMSQFTELARPAGCYLAVWVADDGRERDGDPLADAADEHQAGHGIVRVHAEAFGSAGARRAVQAELARVCPDGEARGCLPGIRVQSWQELREAIP
jgi:hypothetical protein